MIDILEPRVPVFLDVAAWQSWITKAAAAAGGTALVATPLEHNSAMVAFGNLMDELSDPRPFVQRQTTPLGGSGVMFANYAGPEPPLFLTPAGSTAVYNHARLPVVGAQVAPADQQRLIWWEAWREIVDRFGQRWTKATIAAVQQPLTQQNMVLTDGVVSTAVIPLQQIPKAGTLGITEDPDAAKYVSALFNATIAFTQRLVNQANGSTTAADTTQSALELAAQPQIQAISDMYRKEHKSSSLLGAAGIAIAGVVGLMMPGRRGRGRKRR